jgi:hypothetical protein
VAAGETAAVIGMIAVIIFMIAAYGLFGVFANIALAVNIALLLGALSLLQATLTLPGIAGIVLTIGMAVDANVLIFERIREEARAGRSAISSIDTGYRRALTTILDANITTLLAAIILFWFGTGPVRGFLGDAGHRDHDVRVHGICSQPADGRDVGQMETPLARADLAWSRPEPCFSSLFLQAPRSRSCGFGSPRSSRRPSPC